MNAESEPARDSTAYFEPQLVEAVAKPNASSNRALWWEVAAVLAIGVVPSLMAAVSIAVTGRIVEMSYWLDSVYLIVQSACVSLAVLYIIGRSGEGFTAFGIVRPRFADIGIGVVLCLLDLALTYELGIFLPPVGDTPRLAYPVPSRPAQYALMVLKFAICGFAEELVMRAYFVTRFERLLNSRLQAVVLPAMLFAAYHLQYGPAGDLLAIFGMGLLYGGLYLWIRRVWPFAIGHMLINIVFELGRRAG